MSEDAQQNGTDKPVQQGGNGKKPAQKRYRTVNYGSTPTHKRILALLSDGISHSKEELFRECLWDEMGEISNLQMHMSNIRKYLRPLGEDIVCEHVAGRTFYRHVRLLGSPYDGNS